MTYALNSQLAEQLNALQPRVVSFPNFTPGDAFAWRKRADALYALVNELLPATDGVAAAELHIPFNGTLLRARRYSGKTRFSRGLVLYVHGGGGVAGSVNLYDKIVAQYVKQSGVDFISLEYGLAPETAGHMQTEQVTATLAWLYEHSSQLDIDPERIVLMGDSGGGGIAASAALMARDRHLALAGLVLVYPMLDRQVAEVNPELSPFLTVTADEVKTAWQARIGNEISDALPEYVSPAAAQDLTGLPALFIDVGDLDLFCQESMRWASRAASAGVQTECHLYPGVNHGFELLAPASDIARQAISLRCGAIRNMVS